MYLFRFPYCLNFAVCKFIRATNDWVQMDHDGGLFKHEAVGFTSISVTVLETNLWNSIIYKNTLCSRRNIVVILIQSDHLSRRVKVHEERYPA